ncbi:MAG: YciI family protein [Pseudomonadota bacterium]
MTRWAVIFKDTEDMLAIRARKDLRDAHVAYAQAHPELLIGGGLKPTPGDDFCGALWVVEAEDKDDVVSLIENDPFYVSEYRKYEIYTWGKLLEDQVATL